MKVFYFTLRFSELQYLGPGAGVEGPAPPSFWFLAVRVASVYFPFLQVHLSGGLPHPEHTPFLIGMPQAVHDPL